MASDDVQCECGFKNTVGDKHCLLCKKDLTEARIKASTASSENELAECEQMLARLDMMMNKTPKEAQEGPPGGPTF